MNRNQLVIANLESACLTAVGAMESAIDGDAFVAYVQNVLVPVLRPEEVVVLDNLGAHQVAAVKRAIESAGARLLFLPPYSPDLNPIEKCWSKVKQYLRSAAARTKEALGHAIQNAFATVTTEDIRNWFASCGYAVH